MTSTATAAVKADSAECPVTSHPMSVSAANTNTTGTNTADTRSASRCVGLARLRRLDEARHLGQLSVVADAGRPHAQAP